LKTGGCAAAVTSTLATALAPPPLVAVAVIS
jgi:hypothetical protein